MTSATTTTQRTAVPAAVTFGRGDLPEMLLSYALVHDAMTRDADRLVRTLAQADEFDGQGVKRWFATYTAEITHHHEREDELVFPAVVQRSPDFAHDLELLEQDHHDLDVAMATVANSFSVASATAFEQLLRAHLAREEDATFGRIATYFSPEEYAALEKQMLRATPRKLLAFEAPFVLDRLSADVRRERLAPVPAPVRLLYRLLFVPAYHRLDAALVPA